MIRPGGSRGRGRKPLSRQHGAVRDGPEFGGPVPEADVGPERTALCSLLPQGSGHNRGEEGVREMVRWLPWRWRRWGRAGGVPHAAPAARFHRRDLQDPHHCERPAAHGPGRAALDRRGPPRHGHACLEGPALGARAARRARLSQDLLGLLPGHEPAHRAPHVLEGAGWRDERRGAEGGTAVLRLDRVLEVPRQGGAGGRPLRADAQDRPRRADLRRGPARELAVPGRRGTARTLPAARHRARRHAHAVVLGPDRPEVPHRRAPMARGPVRAEPVAGSGTRGSRRDPRPPPAGRAAPLARRFRMGPRRALLVPAGRPGDPQAALVRPRGGGGVGAGGAHGGLARPAPRVGRPLREPRHDMARVRAARARPRDEGRLGPRARRPLARWDRGAVLALHPRRDGAALLSDGHGKRPGLPVALDQHATPGGGGARPRAEPLRRARGRQRARRSGALRRRPVAPRPHARPCDCGYGKRTSVRSWPRHSGRVLHLGRLQWGARHADGGQRVVFPRPRSADAAASVSLSGGGHGRDSRTRHAGGGARPAAGRRGGGRGRAQPGMRGISHEGFPGGTMRKFGSLAAVVAAVLVVALAAWTRQPAGNAQGGATVTGKVKFTGAKPTNPPIDMTEEPKCKAKYTTTPTKETVVVNPNGTLANVFVYVKSGLPPSAKYETPKTAGVIDQDGCHYRPHVLGIMVGQTLEIKNSDGILHNIKAKGVKNRPFNISQPTTMTSTRTFSAPEVMVPLECNVHG